MPASQTSRAGEGLQEYLSLSSQLHGKLPVTLWIHSCHSYSGANSSAHDLSSLVKSSLSYLTQVVAPSLDSLQCQQWDTVAAGDKGLLSQSCGNVLIDL